MRAISIALLILAAVALAGTGGCGAPAVPGVTTSDQELFAPVPVPPEFDPLRARLPLARVPDDPASPPAAAQAPILPLPAPAERHLEEAQRLFAEHRYTETILAAEKALSYAPNDHRAHRLLAVACLLSGSDGRSRLAAQRALEIRPGDLACHYVLGRLAQKAGKQDEALREYRIAAKCEPTREDQPYRALAQYWLGMLLYEAGYYTAAIEQLAAFTSAVEALADQANQNPELATLARVHRGSVAMHLAQAHAILGDYRAAAGALALAVRQSPEDLELRADLVRMLARAGQLDAAAAAAGRFVADSKGDPQAVRLLLAVHRRAGRPEAGVAAIKQIIAAQPENIELWLIYADALVAAGQTDGAIQTLRDLISTHPQAGEARWKLVALHREREDVPAWLTALAEALAVAPADYLRASLELERLAPARAAQIVDQCLKTGQPGAGILSPATAQDQTLASALDFLLGRLCDRLDRVDDARRFFQRAAERSPGFLPGPVGLAELYIARCRWPDAMEVIQRASASRGQPSHLLERLLGQCHDGLDQGEEAVAHYEKAIALNAADVRAMMSLAQLHERYGQRRQARLQYQAAIAADPGRLLARELYIRNLLSSTAELPAMTGRVSLEFAEIQRRGPGDPSTARCAALLAYLQDPDRDQYCKALKEIIRVHTDDLRSRVELATTLLAFREYDEARLQASEVLAREPYSAPGGEIMALALARELEFEQAARQFERILEWYPNRQSWVLQFAELRLADQDYAAAIELFKRLLSLQKEAARQIPYRGKLMEALRLAGRFDEARELAQTWANQEGAHELLRNAARWFMLAADQAEHDYDRYLARCREWLAAKPDDHELRAWLIGIGDAAPLGAAGRFQGRGGLIGARRFAEAQTLVLQWLADSPGDTTMIQWLAEVLQAAGRHEEAIELGQSLLETEGRPYILQTMYARARRYDQAVAAAREALTSLEALLSKADASRRADLESTIFEQRRVIGHLLSQAGHYEDAVAHIEKMLQEADDEQLRADLLRTLAFVHQRHDRTELALQRLREAYALAPLDVGLNNDLGYSLADAGLELEQAERMIRIAAAESPRQAAYLDSLGWVLYKKGDLEAARHWLTRAVAPPGDEDAVIFDHLGDVQWRLGQRDQAIKSWRQSLAVYRQQWADGETDTSEKLVTGLEGKIAAATAGDQPNVAPVAGQKPDR